MLIQVLNIQQEVKRNTSSLSVSNIRDLLNSWMRVRSDKEAAQCAEPWNWGCCRCPCWSDPALALTHGGGQTLPVWCPAGSICISAYKPMWHDTQLCHCPVTQLCLTLCNPMDCSKPYRSAPEHLSDHRGYTLMSKGSVQIPTLQRFHASHEEKSILSSWSHALLFTRELLLERGGHAWLIQRFSLNSQERSWAKESSWSNVCPSKPFCMKDLNRYLEQIQIPVILISKLSAF